MKYLAVVCGLWAIACSGPTWHTHPRAAYECRGIAVIASSTWQVPDRVQFEAVTDQVVLALAIAYDVSESSLWDALDGLTVMCHDDRLPHQDTGASGLYWASRHWIDLHWRGCLQTSAYAHELGHALRWSLIRRGVDYNHADKKLWTTIADIWQTLRTQPCD